MINKIANLLNRLIELDIRIELEGEDNLRIRSNISDVPADILKDLKEQKNALIEYFLLKKIENNEQKYIRIRPADKKEFYPLSSAQKRLYFLQELSPQSTSYNMLSYLFFDESLDLDRLDFSFRKLIERHEILRTCFIEEQGVVVQKILEEVVFSTTYYECESLDRAIELSRSVSPAFDLRKAPLLRSTLIKIKRNYLWIIDIHHIISDGTSQQILISDMMSIYQGIELPALTMSYKDYSEWQNKLAENGELTKQRNYWKEKLNGELPLLNFPTDFPRPPAFTFKGAHYSFRINEKRTAQLKKMGDRYKGTLQMSLMAILKVLLFKYTKQENIVVGCGVSGRSHDELLRVVGMFVNMLAIRTEPADEKQFSSFYKEVISTSLEAYDNQDVQFDDLVDALKIQRDLSRNPIFDIALVVQNLDRTEIKEKSDIVGSMSSDNSMYIENTTSKFDLTFFVDESDGETSITIEYYTGIFKESTVKRIADHFNTILNQVLENENVLLSNINMLSETERQKVLNEFNETTAEYPHNVCIHDLFTIQCQLTPHQIAVSDESGSYTYSEVENHSNRIGNFLKTGLNISQESYIGILQSKSKELIPSILGVLKSGGAYLNLDAELPEERLLYMLKDAKVNYLLTEKSLVGLASRLQWRSGIEHIICVDSEDIYSEHGGLINDLMRKDLWDYVGDGAVDAITAGGWVSSYTGNPINELEMQEYSDNVYLKLKGILHKEMKVLEIGCSSGLTMFKIAPEVASYYGTDLSSSILEYTRGVVTVKGYENIFLSCMPAHEINDLGEKDFDLIIINSVIQCFEDHNYLKDILKKAVGLLKISGYIFAGDIMDEERRADLIKDLEGFKQKDLANEFKTKTDWSSELFVSQHYFTDLMAEDLGVTKVDFSEKIYTIENELTNFRYDALLSINKKTKKKLNEKSKNQYDLRTIRHYKDINPAVAVKADNLCYLMYTSGSTGRPKGVMVKHANLVNLCFWHKNKFSVTEEDRASLYAGLTFDASVWELFPYLLSGAGLYIVPQRIRLDINELNAYFETNKITISFLPTQIAEQFLEVENLSLRYLLVGGEKLNHFKKKNYEVVNNYGPTESTVVATNCIVNDYYSNIPIGRPISNTQIYILNNRHELQPIGFIGEMYIGGDGLAKGYLNQDVLTKEKFIKSPFKTEEYLYKTGDLGRWLPDGNIEFVGRKDTQVKIRGIRIELGEIEHALLENVEIDEAIVLAKENKNNEKEIVAYITSKSEQNTSELRLHLKKSLPEYMLPGYFVQLKALPLTSNGKIDRKSLPDPQGLGLGSGVEYTAPRNKLEEKLVKIWEEVLQRKSIGINDDFFALGGHSLKVVRLSNEYQKQLSVKISLKDLFAYTSIASHEAFIRSSRKTEFIQIEKRALLDSYPISDAQRRLWVLSQFEETSIAYNTPVSIVLEKHTHIESFKRAIASTIERHEILRTVFKTDENEEVRQWILNREDLRFKIDYKDFRKEKNKQESVQSYVHEDSYKPFDLVNGPLLRAALLQVEDESYVFYYNMHHIISDGWSMDVLSKDIFSYYEAYRENKKPALKELRIQYKDYSVWQLSQLEEELFKSHREYWLKNLEGELPLLNLPCTKQRPRLKSNNGRTLGAYLNKDISGKLKAFSQEKGGSLFMGLLASLNAIFYRYTSQKDIIIGSPVAGRDHADLEDQIGFYVNTLALRNEIKSEDSFETLFSRVKDNTLNAYSHQTYPFDRLVEELDLSRDTSRSVVFDVLLLLQNNGKKKEGIQLKEEELNQITDLGYNASKFDIDISAQEIGDYISLHVVYNPDVYEKEMVEGLIKHYKQLLNAVLERPEERISRIDYLCPEEKHKLLVSFNDTNVDLPKDKILIDLFEEQATKTPDHVAVVFEENELSYRELNEQSNKLAAYLSNKHQICKGDLVGIDLERTLDYVIVLLGIQKASGCCAPINPDFPPDRVSGILPNFKMVVDATILKSFRDTEKQYSGKNAGRTSGQNDLAYIIYTSGSTGENKGCMLENKGIVNHLYNKINQLNFNSETVFLHTSKMYFVGGIWQLWVPLVTGGKLIIPTSSELQDISALLTLCHQNKVKIFEVIPSQISNLFSINKNVELDGIEKLILTGEPLKKDLIDTIQKLTPDIEIINTYGQTECSDVTTTYRISAREAWNHRLIGKPIENTFHYIVDKNELLCPIGVTGEIYTSGICVSRGYLNRENLTREKFTSNPFKAGERLYKTGDLGRWTNDGMIEFIGRKDNQVKVRGYRIEPGEIEHALLKNAQIEEAVVLAKENQNKENELVAYIIAKTQQNTSSLRSYLKEFLPEYMLPVYYVQLEELPLTSNGKIDKKALPDPQSLGLASGVAYIAPGNELEEKVLVIWEEILQREHIGVKDDFFALGGHSLKAVRLSNEYHKKFQVKLSLKELFTYTTIEAHARLIQGSEKEEFAPIEKTKHQESYPISDAQRRLWVLSQFEEGSVAYNMPGSIHLDQDINIDSFKKAVDYTIDRHEALRTVFKADQTGEIRQWILTREEICFKIDYKDFRKAENKEELVKSYIVEDTYKAFDLEKGPLLRAALLQLEDELYVFCFNMHHIISDGWSMKVLSKDVFLCYEAYKKNGKPNLEPLRIQYKDYSVWQLVQLKKESFQFHRDYWLKNLSGELPLLDLPTSKKRPDIKTHNGRTVLTYLNKNLTRKLKTYALEREGTLFMSVMSVLNALLYRYTGQSDILLGMQIAGRDHTNVENQIGFYVNSLALRNEVSGDDHFENVYQKVKHSILEAYTHRMYPFDRLVEELEQSRLTSRNAVFDITVVLQNTGEKIQELLIPEESIDDITEHERGTCIYDIKFDFQEEGDYLRLMVEYNKDVYEAEMIEGFIRHFKSFTSLALDSTKPIKAINYLSESEKYELVTTFNATETDYPKDKTIIDLFQEQVKKHKQNAAITYGNVGYNYEALNARSNQVAHFLLKEADLKKEEKVGLLLNAGLDTVAAMLGILKAGGAYVPMDPALPEDRLSFMVSDLGMRILITQKTFIESANKLQWGASSLKNYLCIDSEDVKSEAEDHKNVMMSQELWDHVGERSHDQITGGGWLSSYTGKAIPHAEMEEYTLNVYKKLKSSLHADMRVLEIGCSSGLSLGKIAPEVSLYYGTDLSPVIISKTKKLIEEKGLRNVKLRQLVAHEVSKLEENDFDLIIINSVIQHFHGHNYLLKVIRDSIGLLKEKGRIFIGDVMDLNKKKDLIEDLELFKRTNEEEGNTTKTDFSADLFVSRAYFEDLKVDEKEILEVEISEKIRIIENELTKFRYDVILHIDKSGSPQINEIKAKTKKHKGQYGRTHLDLQSEGNPMINILPHQLAYIIYTSGTTGTPKGVMIEHGSLLNYLTWAQSKYKEGVEGFNFGLFTSLSFDLTVSSIYLPLISGGTLSVFDSTSDIVTVLKTYFLSKINCIKLTPAHVSLLKDLDIKETAIETAIVGGEALTKMHVETLKKLNPLMRVYNEYGPTESTVGCIVAEITSTQQEITIGQPIANTQIYILSEGDELQPAGVNGEICIGGAGLARGYFNSVELTKEKFIANPFKAGARIYKTGDLGRWLPDQTVEYIGRKDDQVKIRGYRIELAEIEHALQNHKDIEEVVILVKKNKNNEKELVGYFVAKTDQTAGELRSYLKELLPEYMVPNYFVQLKAMPLNSNGKINKKALPNPEGLGLASGTKYTAPRNELEEKLVVIWQEVLQRDHIGIKDDFFALGGHSLKAVRLSNEYVKQLSVKISLKELFAHTTIASQAELIYFSNKTEFIQIRKVTQQESYPISDAQRRLWVLSQFEEASVAYNTPASIVLGKKIDIESFKKALASTIERHEILRTVFKTDENGEVRQWIVEKKDLGFKIDYKDYRKEKNKQETIQSYINEDSYKLFDLVNGPLLRAALLQVEDESYVFYYNMHHIISDGWSMEVLYKDLLSYYEAYKENKQPDLVAIGLKELRIQYKDYSAWQLAQVQEESFKAHRNYWLESLKGELPLLDLPGIKQRPKLKTHNGRVLSTYIGLQITKNLKKYSEQHGGSLFMGLLAAWNILIYRYTSQTDVIIGTPIAGRDHADLEDQIGFYVNTLALRNEINPQESFHAFYSVLKENMLKSYHHQMYPFDRLVEELSLQRDTSRSPVFDISITYHPVSKTKGIVLPENKNINQVSDQGLTKVKNDIELHFQEGENHISFNLKYNTDIYDKKMVERVMIHYQQLLDALLQYPEEKLSHIDYLSQQEKQELLVSFNNTKVDYPKNKTIVDLFEEQAEKTPDQIAVVFNEKKLSYKELNELSNQLAHYLRKNYQVQPDNIVGVQLDRSEWMVVAMLGVLKSGGAYVPIDPDYPSSRKEHIVKDTSLKLLITEAAFIYEIDYYEGEVFAIDVQFDHENYSSEKLITSVTSENLAYVIYTSGSTGKPKGTMVEHKGIVNTLQAQIECFQINSKNKGLQFASFSFDASISETFIILLSGASLFIVSGNERNDPKLLTAFINLHQIDIATLPPSYLNRIDLNELKSLTKLITAGESAFYQKAIEHLNVGTYYNAYGPTETSICATIFKLENKNFLSTNSLPIGKPISNTEIYILSEKGRLQPKEVIGEICIGGSGLARGYLNQTQLSKEKFIENPFKAGACIYKTGDLGRWLADGNIEFIGRKDDQVKIRGYRIELGEIEQALLKNEQIIEVVVVARENQDLEKEIVAYITAKAAQNTSDLRNYLKEILPEYMLPTYFIQLETLPLTSNGKIDKKSLRDSKDMGLVSSTEYVAPQNEIEEKLVKIWEEILKKEKVGIKDDFFDLGGDSLKVIKMINQINKQFGFKYDLKGVYAESTVELISQRIKIDNWFTESTIENTNDYKEVKI